MSIRRCPKCNQLVNTIVNEERCPTCGEDTLSPQFPGITASNRDSK